MARKLNCEIKHLNEMPAWLETEITNHICNKDNYHLNDYDCVVQIYNELNICYIYVAEGENIESDIKRMDSFQKLVQRAHFVWFADKGVYKNRFGTTDDFSISDLEDKPVFIQFDDERIKDEIIDTREIFPICSENAIIKSVRLSTEEYCALTLSLELDLGRGCCCVLGGISLGNEDPVVNLEPTEHGNYAAYFITKVLEVVGVQRLNELVGKPVRAIFTGNGGLGESCIGIQHFLKDGIFFIPTLNNPYKKYDLSSIMNRFDFERYEYCEKFCCKDQNIFKSMEKMEKTEK